VGVTACSLLTIASLIRDLRMDESTHVDWTMDLTPDGIGHDHIMSPLGGDYIESCYDPRSNLNYLPNAEILHLNFSPETPFEPGLVSQAQHMDVTSLTQFDLDGQSFQFKGTIGKPVLLVGV